MMLKTISLMAMMLAIISANIVSSTGPGAQPAPPVQRVQSVHRSAQPQPVQPQPAQQQSVQGMLKVRPPPKLKLSKDGKQNEKILKSYDTEGRIGFMKNSLKQAGRHMNKSQNNIDALHRKLEKVEKIPNTIKGRVKSFFPNTAEGKLRKEHKDLHQQLRQENKNLQQHRDYALNAIRDSRILRTSEKITHTEKKIVDQKAAKALAYQHRGPKRQNAFKRTG